MIFKKSQLLVSITFITFSAAAQQTSKYEVGIHAGASLYLGDIVPRITGSYKSPGFTYGITGYKKLSQSISLRAALMSAKIHANDSNYQTPEWRKQRNFNFKTNITEINLAVVYSPLSDRNLSPYVFAGVGYDFLKVTYDYSKFNTEFFGTQEWVIQGLQEDANHTSPRRKFVVPLGAGLRYQFNDRFAINAETNYRVISTDYLDGFSKAANPNKNDNYFTHTLGIIFTFPGKNMLACPKK